MCGTVGLERLRVDLEPAAVVGCRGRRRRGSAPSVAPTRPAAYSTISERTRRPPSRMVTGQSFSISMPLHLGAEAQRDAAVAQLVDEVVDQLAVDELEHAWPRLDQRHRDVERAEDGGVFDADDAGADHRQAARQAGDLQRSRRCRRRWCRRTARRPGGAAGCRRRSGCARPGRCGCRRRPRSTSMRCGSRKRAVPMMVCTALRANWCSSTSTSWSSVMCRRAIRSLAAMSFFTR